MAGIRLRKVGNSACGSGTELNCSESAPASIWQQRSREVSVEKGEEKHWPL